MNVPSEPDESGSEPSCGSDRLDEQRHQRQGRRQMFGWTNV